MNKIKTLPFCAPCSWLDFLYFLFNKITQIFQSTIYSKEPPHTEELTSRYSSFSISDHSQATDEQERIPSCSDSYNLIEKELLTFLKTPSSEYHDRIAAYPELTNFERGSLHADLTKEIFPKLDRNSSISEADLSLFLLEYFRFLHQK